MAINPYVPAAAIGNGAQVDFSFTFPYLSQLHVKASINGVLTPAFTFFSANVLRFSVAPSAGAAVRIFRETPADTLAAVIQPGGPIPVVGLNQNFLQGLYYNQETQYDAANQSTAGLQAQITAATNTANTALTVANTNTTFTQDGAGAVGRSVTSKLKDIIHVKDFGAVGNGIADDTTAIQAAITAAAGKTLVFDAVTYKTTSTLTISTHGTKLICRGALIDYYGTAVAVGFGLVGGTTYPVEVEIHNLNINVNNGPSSAGLQVRTSYSRYYNVNVLLKSGAVSAKGFVLVGDEANGTGPYYNYFQACSVASQSSGTDHTGVLFSSQAPLHRAPNATTWVGGRIGQCATGFYIVGGGNTFLHPTIENAPTTGIAVDFVSPAASTCTQNNVIGAYVENANTAFRFGSGTISNGLFNPYVTGASTFITDSGTDNLYITGNAATKLPTGVRFGTLSSDANVLDYYEEGTWTPTLVGSSTAGSYTLTSGTAKYTRIGRVVHVTFSSTITINTAGTGVARFGGLPFAKGAGTILTGAAYAANFTLPASNSGICVNAWTSSVDSTFYLVLSRTGTSVYDVTCADINAGASVTASFTYFV